ncbi:hypothetical protein A2154_05270 [Candidatus Gottesmanbacteria bacterium RBG_16_43_7]|uniref:Regulatory protein YycH domain-containing protein n=1 Tax=Candidatus Gottesmanbacteria bacterium RBG_16_43_7 TaxID=1798373 RepID=A0A1F5Z9D9_9BACT|nr:MAG: hypothetical protein A2154_05270 [Candidatus Gottesmanbacteria bacterium RBG_16_43_7]
MATLTETAYYTRRTINWTILGIIAYFILRLTWAILVFIYFILFPPKPPPPNHAFGVLPKIQFPQSVSRPSDLKFRLETIEGTVPTASESASVYFMPKSPANLLALTRTQTFAQRLGLNPEPIQESKNIYIFKDPDLSLRTLRYDIVSNNFVLRYAYELDPLVFDQKNLPNDPKAITDAQSILKGYNLYVNDYKNGTTRITYLQLVGNKLLPILSRVEADALRVDFFRKPIGDMKVFTADPDLGLINFLYSGNPNTIKQLMEFNYTYWPIDYDTVGTYEMKRSQDAWQELVSGGGFIARYPRTGSTAVVRTMHLGYYDSYQPQTYLQPIFVFEGDDGFLGYVPAVSLKWVEQ